jgi:phage gp46-like protein
MAYDAILTDDYDFQLTDDGDIATVDAFDTALLMSLFCERRATESEIPSAHLRRGWIGNESDQEGFEIGSKLWLYEQSRITKTLIQEIVSATLNGLQWLIDDNLATSINVSAKLQNNNIVIEVIISRPNSKVDYRYFEFWSNTGAA